MEKSHFRFKPTCAPRRGLVRGGGGVGMVAPQRKINRVSTHWVKWWELWIQHSRPTPSWTASVGYHLPLQTRTCFFSSSFQPGQAKVVPYHFSNFFCFSVRCTLQTCRPWDTRVQKMVGLYICWILRGLLLSVLGTFSSKIKFYFWTLLYAVLGTGFRWKPKRANQFFYHAPTVWCSSAQW